MIESELSSLELQVDDFVKSFQQLTIENKSLRKEVVHLNQERTALLNKQKKIAEALKKITIQLRDRLSCQAQ
jgi:uncharacterized protein (TIGR02449 family)